MSHRTNDFINKFNKLISDFTQINEWDKYYMLYLGGNLSPKTTYVPTNINNIYTCNNIYGTHAYIFNSSNVNNIITVCINNNIEIDCCYSNLTNTYIIKPSLVTQKSGYSNILNRKTDYTSKQI